VLPGDTGQLTPSEQPSLFGKWNGTGILLITP
jgi:hypothetical protein